MCQAYKVHDCRYCGSCLITLAPSHLMAWSSFIACPYHCFLDTCAYVNVKAMLSAGKEQLLLTVYLQQVFCLCYRLFTIFIYQAPLCAFKLHLRYQYIFVCFFSSFWPVFKLLHQAARLIAAVVCALVHYRNFA